jgi:hypothetical protein
MHPIFTFPAAYIIDTYGTRTGILIGSLLGSYRSIVKAVGKSKLCMGDYRANFSWYWKTFYFKLPSKDICELV